MQNAVTPVPDLSDRAMAAWMSKLPSDVRAALSVPGESSSEGPGDLPRALGAAAAAEMAGVVGEHFEEAASYGRARRVRLMAWMARQPERSSVFRKLQEEGAGESAGGRGDGRSAVLFLEDIRALAAALSHRVARQVASEATVEAVLEAAAHIENDAVFRQGGVG